MHRNLVIGAALLSGLTANSAQGQTPPLGAEEQPRVVGGGFLAHHRVEPVTGSTLGSLLRGERESVPSRSEALRELRGSIDWSVLDRLVPGSPLNRIRLPIFDGDELELVLDHRELRGDQSYTWFGRIAGIAISDVVLVREQDVVHANVRDYPGGRTWTLRWDGSGTHALRLLDKGQNAGSSCGTDSGPVEAVQAGAPPGSGSSLALGSTSDPVDQVDVLFVATSEAFAEYGSVSAFKAAAEAFVADFNMRCANSTVNVALRVSGTDSFSGYSENDDGGVDLDRVTDDGDGFLDSVHDLRDTCRADLVALIRKEPWNGDCVFTGCTAGTAWRPNSLSAMASGMPNGFEGGFGFSVTSLQGDEQRTFSHEIGHNFGACHDAAQGGCSTAITSSPRGIYRACEDIFGSAFCVYTTMAYSPGCFYGNDALPYWSRENLYVDVTGIPSCDDLEMWDSESNVANLMTVSRDTLSQNRIGATLRWASHGLSPSQSGNGTYAYPFATIAESVASVEGGPDEGEVRAWGGTYLETINAGGPVVLSGGCRIVPEFSPITLR